MNRIKTAVLAGVLGFSGVAFLNAPASAGLTDARPSLPPVQVRATHTMSYTGWTATSFAPAARVATTVTPSPVRPARDWSTGRELTLAKPWLTPSR